MRILLTGAAGFLGTALRKEIPIDVELTTLDKVRIIGHHLSCDISDPEELTRTLKGLHFHLVIHLAGLLAGTPSDLHRVNVLGTTNLIEKVDSERILVASSSAVYGAPQTSHGSVSEKHPLEPASDYGKSMLEREHASADAHIIRLFNITGPGQKPGMLVPDFASKLARIAVGIDTGPILTGPLNTERDYLDVSDAAKAFLTIGTSEHPPSVVNIGSGVSRSGSEVMDVLTTCMGISPKIQVRQLPPGVKRIRADISLAKQSFGWKPLVSFQESMSGVAKYWLKKVMYPST